MWVDLGQIILQLKAGSMSFKSLGGPGYIVSQNLNVKGL